jgi:hypothetical protein
MMSPGYLWRPDRQDLFLLSLIIILPVFVCLPQLIGVLQANPMIWLSGNNPGLNNLGNLGLNVRAGLFPGTPYADPNIGFQTQALGRLTMEQWLSGSFPWWNSYSGVGLPLAGEYQPAIFSPLTLPLALPNGLVWQHMMLQIVAGWGCFALCRQLGLGRLACLTAGILFSQNGTFAWFGHAPAAAAVFLPWLLLAIERAAAQTESGWRHGWRLFALVSGLSLLSGFPETEYIDFIFAFFWVIVRLIKMPKSSICGFFWRLCLGAGIGIGLAAAQLLVFFEFLPLANVGSHSGLLGKLILGPLAISVSLLTPYIFGPIFAYLTNAIFVQVWAFIGGHIDSLELIIAAYGLWYQRDALGWMLALWSVFAIGRSFGMPAFADVFGLLPGISDIMFCRYAPPTWEFATIILIAFGIDAISNNAKPRREPKMVAAILALISALFLLVFATRILPWEPSGWPKLWTSMSVVWAIFSTCLAISALGFASVKRRTSIIAILLVFDSTAMFTIPTLSNPRGGAVDTAATTFLQQNIGFERFYTLGPFSPNFSAYFQIGAINDNYIPLPKLWSDWINRNLDPAADPLVFTGISDPNPAAPSPAEELNRNFPAYEEVGVKYVLTPAGVDPFTETSPPKVYSDPLMDIYQLPAPAPYFETPGVACSLQPQSRTAVAADCPGPTTLIRRELFFPGWRAEINGHETPIIEQNGLFEAINLPAGQSKITYSYAPPHIIWAWLLMALALITLITPSFIRRPKTI